MSVADSLPILDAALRALIAGFPGIEVIADPPGAVAGAIADPRNTGRDGGPSTDVVLVACADPGNLGALVELVGAWPDRPVVLVAVGWSGEQAWTALEAGARGCLSGMTTPEELAAALRQVARGEVALSPDVTRAIIERLGRVRTVPRRTGPALSPREAEVLALVCDGRSNKEIAQRLYLSLRTVENHLAAVYAKLGVASRTEAALLAIRTGLIEPPE